MGRRSVELQTIGSPGWRTGMPGVGAGVGIAIWNKRYAGLGISELHELRQLREENGKRKPLVADLSPDRHLLPGIVRKKYRWRNHCNGLVQNPAAA